MADEKKIWLKELANFVVEGHTKGWAAKESEVKPVFPGMKSIIIKMGLGNIVIITLIILGLQVLQLFLKIINRLDDELLWTRSNKRI